ncbi:hypothetical protein OIHEL45_16556 [Sulfitobacter indolifex HEL-45]|uniref:Uncharacterized protein n=1 Tax=Sulfitobacter indolifex HEL-45 TaxID=391624 RepID=A0ABM9X290_9RHOB|nr:hypothetical protein OIHEL45_16556 [Sulfitobacter indolifex HEL-45]
MGTELELTDHGVLLYPARNFLGQYLPQIVMAMERAKRSMLA